MLAPKTPVLALSHSFGFSTLTQAAPVARKFSAPPAADAPQLESRDAHSDLFVMPTTSPPATSPLEPARKSANSDRTGNTIPDYLSYHGSAEVTKTHGSDRR